MWKGRNPFQLLACTHLLLDGHLVVIPDGIFTEEIKFDDVFFTIFLLVERNVLHAKRTTADLTMHDGEKESSSVKICVTESTYPRVRDPDRRNRNSFRTG